MDERFEQPELLDLGAGSQQDVIQNLHEIQRINDWFGGSRALTRHLFPLLANTPAPVRVLDAGTGGGGLSSAIARWAIRHRRAVEVVGLDLAWRNLRVARETTSTLPGVPLVQADALQPPLAAGSVDYVASILFMHHFSPEALAELLRACFACSRRGIVMSDLVRGRLPYLAYHLIAPLFARNHLTRADGLLSIRRAYRPAELRAIARAAGLPAPQITVHWPWRMTLVALR